MRATSIHCRTGITVTARLRRTSKRTSPISSKDRYRQHRDRTRQSVAQLSTLNSCKKLTAIEVRLLAKKLSKENIRKYSRFDTFATTLYDQQDARDEAHRRYDAHVQSSSAQIVQLTHSHEAKLEYEVRQAKAQVDIANERVQTSEAQAQFRLQEQTQRADMLISELRRALKETADQAIANTRTAAELEVHLRKELLEAQHRLAELEPAWSMFIARHNDEEEAREQEQRHRAAVAAQPSERIEDCLWYYGHTSCII